MGKKNREAVNELTQEEKDCFPLQFSFHDKRKADRFAGFWETVGLEVDVSADEEEGCVVTLDYAER